MKYGRILCLLAAMVIMTLCTSNVIAFPTVYPTGTTIFNPEKAMKDVFIMVVHMRRITIIDRNGNEYNSWNVPRGWGNLRARLDEKGNLLLGGSIYTQAPSALASATGELPAAEVPHHRGPQENGDEDKRHLPADVLLRFCRGTAGVAQTLGIRRPVIHI